MSDLIDYIDTHGGAALAKRLGVSRGLVSHWRRGRTQPSPKMARALERVSGGALRAAKLRPDIFD